MSHEASAHARRAIPGASAVASGAGECVSRLAQFFTSVSPVRLPVRVTAEASHSEQTVIEYGTPREVLFVSGLPLEFGDRLRVRNADGSLDAEAVVVALQFHSGHTAVAARFAHDVANWIVKP